jgi:phosphoglycolate phosphatase
VSTPLLVFDLDGTLVDSTRDLAAATNAALLQVAPGAKTLPVETVQGFVGNGARVLIEKALAHAGLDLPADDVLPVFVECYERGLLETTRAYPGIPEALDNLGGCARAVLTNKPGPLARKLLEGLGLASAFDRIWGPEDVPERKPSGAGLEKLMQELDASPETTWMIGDSAVDVRTARAAGVRVAGVTWGLAPADLEKEPPDRLVADARELKALISR